MNKAFIFYRNFSSNMIHKDYKHYFYLTQMLNPLHSSQARLVAQYFPELAGYMTSGPRVEVLKEVISSFEFVLGRILPLTTSNLLDYKARYDIDSFHMVLPLGETLLNRMQLQSLGVVIHDLPLPSFPLTNYTAFYRSLCAHKFNCPFVPVTSVQHRVARLLSDAFYAQPTYAFNRTLIDSAGTSQLSRYVGLGCISFEQLMTYFESLSGTQFHRQLGWILYCKLKHQFVTAWQLPPLCDVQVIRINAFIKGALPVGFVNDWVNTTANKLLDGLSLSNRARLMMSAYLIRDLGIHWRWGDVLWRLLLIDSHPLINAYNWRAQSRNRFLKNYNLRRQIVVHSGVPHIQKH